MGLVFCACACVRRATLLRVCWLCVVVLRIAGLVVLWFVVSGGWLLCVVICVLAWY